MAACGRLNPDRLLIDEAIRSSDSCETSFERCEALYGIAAEICVTEEWVEFAVDLVEQCEVLRDRAWDEYNGSPKSAAIAAIALRDCVSAGASTVERLWSLVDKDAGDPDNDSALILLGVKIGVDRRRQALELAWQSCDGEAACIELARGLDLEVDRTLIDLVIEGGGSKSFSMIVALLPRTEDSNKPGREHLRQQLLRTALNLISALEIREDQRRSCERLGRVLTRNF